MKKIVIPFILLFTYATQAQAKNLTTSIHEIDIPKDIREDVIIKTTDGRVLWADARDMELLETLKKSSQAGTQVKLDIDRDGSVMEAKTTKLKAQVFELNDGELSPVEKLLYAPTNFSSTAQLQTAFNTMNPRTQRDSQCYNRAHVWAYDLWRNRGINSMKLFIFFTNKYIRAYRFHWWFHVTPMSYVNGVEYAIDREFTSGPRTVRSWTNVFMRNDAQCRYVSNYFSYRKDDPNEWCYLINSTMYYWGTVSLRNRDRGYTRSSFNLGEVNTARREAFY